MKKEKIVRYSANKLPPITEKDRKMLCAAKRKPIDFDDIPELTVDDFKRAVLMPPITDPAWAKKMDVMIKSKKTKEKTINIASDTDTWFSRFGSHYEERVNAALRLYMLAHDLPR